MKDNEALQLANDHQVQNLQDIISNDEYSYSVIPLDEFCEQPFDPQKGNDHQLCNNSDIYRNFEIDIEQLRTEVQDMSTSPSQLPNLGGGSKTIENLTSNGISIPLNSGDSINHSQLNHCVSIPQLDIMHLGREIILKYKLTKEKLHNFH